MLVLWADRGGMYISGTPEFLCIDRMYVVLNDLDLVPYFTLFANIRDFFKNAKILGTPWVWYFFRLKLRCDHLTVEQFGFALIANGRLKKKKEKNFRNP